MKKALITGIGGQDGSYLAEHLLRLGYEVHGIARGITYENLGHLDDVRIHVADMRDEVSLENVFRKVWPDELYNLAAQVFVPTSWSMPEDTFDINVGGLTRILKIVKRLKKDTRVYQASSSEMYGNVNGSLDESTPMRPVSPYGCSKLAAHQLANIYRENGLYVVAGILFNHESPRRGDHMVTRKITQHVAKWACGGEDKLKLGNVDASRDWGHARDYVKAMHLMLQQPAPDDYVIGTGVTHSVSEFLQQAIFAAGLSSEERMHLVEIDSPDFTRQNELFYLRANAAKAKMILKWEAETNFEQLVREMVVNDIAIEKKRLRYATVGA